MNNYEISVEAIGGYVIKYYVSFNRKPLIHEAWAWLEKKHGNRTCYLKAETVSVIVFNIEPFEV
jgi:hypothetical protein